MIVVIPQAAQQNRHGKLSRGALQRLAAHKNGIACGPTGSADGFYWRLPHSGLKLLAGLFTKTSYKPCFDFKALMLKDAMVA